MPEAAEASGGKTLGEAPWLRGVATGPMSHPSLGNPNLVLFHAGNHRHFCPFPYFFYIFFFIPFLFSLVALHSLFLPAPLYSPYPPLGVVVFTYKA